MATGFETIVEFGGRRFATAEAGVRALAASVQQPFIELNAVAKKELKDLLDTAADAVAARHQTPWNRSMAPATGLPTGARTGKLSRRSGALVRQLKASVRVSGGQSALAEIRGSIGGNLRGNVGTYAPVHEHGATIRPRRAKYLTIPLPAALTARGTPIRRSARQWRNTFVARSRKGNLLIFQRRGNDIVPLYLLKTQVKIPPRLGLGVTMRTLAPVIEDRLFLALVRSLRSKGVPVL